jgi:hypothetical protein
MDNDELHIGPDTPVNKIIQYYPETTDYFVELGVCGCEFEPPGRSSLKKTLSEIAKDKGIPLSEIISKIKDIIK